ncbi:MAG TPA: DUF2807 domain-containing protein [Chitinophagaceae bacterium]|nr:DUF2807 domain-containing protein [Chitinophagaceae bacterium]
MKIIVKCFSLLYLSAILFCSCTKEPDNPVTKNFIVSDYKKVETGDQHRITITRGSGFSVVAKGEQRDINELIVRVNNGILKFEYNQYRANRKRVYLTITLPSLEGINLSGQSEATVSGFAETNLVQLNVSGQSACWVNMNAPKFLLEASGQSKIEFQGGTSTGFQGYASGQSEILAYGLSTVVSADVTAEGQSVIKVKVGNIFKANASGQSRIYYQGDPLISQITATGDAKVVKQ